MRGSKCNSGVVEWEEPSFSPSSPAHTTVSVGLQAACCPALECLLTSLSELVHGEGKSARRL